MWNGVMGILMLAAYMSAAVEPPHVSGVLGSPLNLTTSISPDDVEGVLWKFIDNGTENWIVTIKNGSFVDVHDGYKQYGKGTVLEINNLTEKDQRIYIADITFLNNSMKVESFNVTVCGNKNARNHLDIVVFLVVAFVVAAVILLVLLYLKCRKRCSDRNGKGVEDQIEMEKRYKDDDHENEDNPDEQEPKERENDPQQNGDISVEKQILMEEGLKNDEHEKKEHVGTSDNLDEQELKEQENDLSQNGDINNQDEGQADEDVNKVKAHENKDEHQNEDNLTHPFPEIGVEKQILMEEGLKNDEHEKKELLGTSDNPDEQELKERENDLSQNGDINNQDEGQADEDVNKVKAHENKDEHQNEDNLTHPFPEIGVEKQILMEEGLKNDEHEKKELLGTSDNPDEQELKERENDLSQNGDINNQDEGQADEDVNKVKAHENKDEHQNEDNLTHPFPEIGSHKVWTRNVYENEVNKYKEDEYWKKNRENQLQDTSDLGDIVRKDEDEGLEKNDADKNNEGSPFVEDTGATTASKTMRTRLTDIYQPY
ncbi:uncharacterized protein [Phyllobates terribilis]|uniref:uncharacterized protein isoform X2 n=1 Tax=Phyllobates terribilis TaxID=111132 RepID=UPI003CCB06C3